MEIEGAAMPGIVTVSPSPAPGTVEKHSQEGPLKTADLSTALLRSSGRDDKGRAALPLSVVAE